MKVVYVPYDGVVSVVDADYKEYGSVYISGIDTPYAVSAEKQLGMDYTMIRDEGFVIPEENSENYINKVMSKFLGRTVYGNFAICKFKDDDIDNLCGLSDRSIKYVMRELNK